MRPFDYRRAGDEAQALALGGRFLAGGTTLIDLMRLDVERPERVTDITRLPLRGVEDAGGGLRIGALASNTAVAEHPLVRQRYPLLSEAIRAGASQQIRNMASMSGNVMQRTRCPYFRNLDFPSCNKRDPGSGCGAIEGDSRKQAILGTSDCCIATHASDAAVPLVALDCTLTLHGPEGEREVALTDFLLKPENHPDLEHDLRPGELIVSLNLPALPWAVNSTYIKVRERESYSFALASAAVAVDLDGDTVRDVRIALGGVGTVPWRAREAEDALKGQPATRQAFEQAARLALQDARPLQQNAYKVGLAQSVIVRALERVTRNEEKA
ncbi:xanthine dehydrogenase family protein subunit M (plasmid) [Deinococcus metallilatus]|uniref:Xanthine dehydrogenase YagS FAD-binding subunit n=1 Tax=Deinococcus metallilatus TaxID=1211322 RepID=A0ABR6MNP7_9DEIO|nr:xanthine dehydrogenase family protein subunit M [Deinococcus metallilatus]MBB5293566.1 xanthine dehydrogenase YagS FAD-binding subunit [Deinococcus metallilatus]QBY06634.1 xanthine dehydrogenase family protein subunit M [Deinococcus metallilatus]RXJ17977.1 xanthine dehydrogenase family protein subunit M [Deinococcus metallilatus]GMA15214.1 carbon-monoxide dehydrogenase medium subunit [Deinococcus metallilatus]